MEKQVTAGTWVFAPMLQLQKYDRCKSFSGSSSCKRSHGCHQDGDVTATSIPLWTRLDCRFDLTSNWFVINTTQKNELTKAMSTYLHLWLWQFKNEFTSVSSAYPLRPSCGSSSLSGNAQTSHSQDTSSSSTERIPRCSQACRERQSLQRVLGLPLGLLSVEQALNTSVWRHPGGIWSRVRVRM